MSPMTPMTTTTGPATGAAAVLPGTPGPLPVLKGFASLRRLAGTIPPDTRCSRRS